MILADATRHPLIFVWVGAPTAASLEHWIAEHAVDVPDDLVALWRATGGGTIFETEELLVPLGAPDAADDLWSCNQWHRSQGMPSGFLVFHEGLCLSAVRAMEPRYVTVTAPGYTVEGEYASLWEWYCRTLREEYGERYGLSRERGAVQQRDAADEVRDGQRRRGPRS